MKFEHIPINPDGGGFLKITSENEAEIFEVVDHFRLIDKDTVEGVKELGRILAAGAPYVYVDQPTKRFWYAFESALELESSQPYVDLLKKLTGFDCGILPDLDLTQYHPRRLCHTHITDRLFTDHGHICYVGYVTSEDWDGRKAAERAPEYLLDQIIEDFGFRHFEGEFNENGGHITRNPNYLKHHKAQPGLGSPWLWKQVFLWWLANHASAQQKKILAAADSLPRSISDKDWEIRECGHEQCSLVSYSIYYLDANGTVDWDNKGTQVSCISWEKFAKLGKE